MKTIYKIHLELTIVYVDCFLMLSSVEVEFFTEYLEYAYL